MGCRSFAGSALFHGYYFFFPVSIIHGRDRISGRWQPATLCLIFLMSQVVSCASAIFCCIGPVLPHRRTYDDPCEVSRNIAPQSPKLESRDRERSCLVPAPSNLVVCVLIHHRQGRATHLSDVFPVEEDEGSRRRRRSADLTDSSPALPCFQSSLNRSDNKHNFPWLCGVLHNFVD